MSPLKIKKNDTELVGPETVARILKVSRNTVLNWAKQGKIPAIIIGKTYRFHLDSVASELKIDNSIFSLR